MVTSQLLITPLIFVSFLISLVLVDSEYTSRRSKSSFHKDAAREVSSDSLESDTAFADAVTSTERDKKRESKEREWHWHTLQRHMLSLELEDAYASRGRVAVVIVVLGLVGLVAALWALKRAVVMILA